MDSELQSRATILHDNAVALDKQEREIVTETAGLRREREKLAQEAESAARKLKEVGNVQNWAEVLERQFMVLEETVRLVEAGSETGSETASSCSCSDCGKADEMDVTDDQHSQDAQEAHEEIAAGDGTSTAGTEGSPAIVPDISVSGN